MSVKLRSVEYEVRCVKDRLGEAKSFVSEFHYSKGCSHTAVYAHGLFRKGDDTLLGVALWLPPTKPSAQSVNRDRWRRVLSLSHLCIHPSLGTNAASFLMGRSIRRVREIGEWVSLVTYADEFMNHTGNIYRATNWIYVGKMKGSVRWEDPTGKQVSVLATKSRTPSPRWKNWGIVGSAFSTNTSSSCTLRFNVRVSENRFGVTVRCSGPW